MTPPTPAIPRPPGQDSGDAGGSAPFGLSRVDLPMPEIEAEMVSISDVI